MREITTTYILVGNHDMENNMQFLTTNHWMNGMKEWNNVVIVDTVVVLDINSDKFVFVPYVTVGRFEEALNTVEGWKEASCIFAHQEFYGCKMGAIVSIEGDKWSLQYPSVVSGHIHSKQTIQENVYYSGSAMQHAFGESEENIIAYFTFEGGKYEKEEVNLQLPRKKIVYMDVDDLDDYTLPDTDDKIKLTISGEYEQFKALKKTKKYKNLVETGVKVVFKQKKAEVKKKVDSLKADVIEGIDFQDILDKLVTEQADPFLYQTYQLIIHGNEVETDSIMFIKK